MTDPLRLPDAASLETVLAGLDPAAADANLIPALTAAFPGLAFGIAPIDDDYWRDTRSVLRPDGTRLGELRPWMTAELAKDNGDVTAVWKRLKDTDLQITEWRGTTAFVSAPTGPGVADYVQIARGREVEWRAGPIVNPDYRPGGEEELLDPELAPYGSASRRGSPRRSALSPPRPCRHRGGPRPQFSRSLRPRRARQAGGQAARYGTTRHPRSRTNRDARNAVP